MDTASTNDDCTEDAEGTAVALTRIAGSRLLVLAILFIHGSFWVRLFPPEPWSGTAYFLGVALPGVLVAYFLHIGALAKLYGGMKAALTCLALQLLPIIGVPLAISLALKAIRSPQSGRLT